jgi:hypothetical protein
MVFALHTTGVHATVDGPALSATKVALLMFKLQHKLHIHRFSQQFALTCARMEVLAPLQMYALVQPDGEELLVLFVRSFSHSLLRTIISLFCC